MTPFVTDPDFTLYVGDALDVLRGLPAASVDCAATSPPFYALRDYGVDGQIGLEATPDEWVARLVEVFGEVRRVLRPEGTLWIECGDSYNSATSTSRSRSTLEGSHGYWANPLIKHRINVAGAKAKDLLGTPWLLAFALRADGWWLRQVIVWDKPNPIPESAKDRPTTSHEYVLLLAKSRIYWYDANAIAEPATWERWGAQTMRKEVVGKARLAKNRSSKLEIKNGIAKATRNARSVWRIVCAQFEGDHAAVMPLELAERCIRAGAPEGGLVLDPFAGAGTTALAARNLKRRSIGIELSAKSCAIAADRLAQQQLATEVPT